MTVWVAAVNVSDRAIVMVSDTMASLAGGAFCPDETLLKVANVHRAWSAMYAGNDITPVYPILPRVRTEVSPQGWSSSPAIGVSVVQAAFARAYRAERTARAEQLLLGPYGLDMATFNARGLKIFGESGAAIMRDRIERVEFDCEFLVCGFDEASRPHIFTVGNRGVVSDYDTPGYWAIGSGYLNALGALALRGHNQFCSLETLVYDACEAKFAAENATGVGKDSFMVVQRPDLRRRLLPPEQMSSLRKAWNKYGKSRRPVTADARLKEWIRRELPEQPPPVGIPGAGEPASSG